MPLLNTAGLTSSVSNSGCCINWVLKCTHCFAVPPCRLVGTWSPASPAVSTCSLTPTSTMAWACQWTSATLLPVMVQHLRPTPSSLWLTSATTAHTVLLSAHLVWSPVLARYAARKQLAACTGSHWVLRPLAHCFWHVLADPVCPAKQRSYHRSRHCNRPYVARVSLTLYLG
jgi:hypothetical protein